MTQIKYIVVAAPGHYGNRTIVRSSHRTLGAARSGDKWRLGGVRGIREKGIRVAESVRAGPRPAQPSTPPLTPADLRTRLAALGLSQRGLARLYGVNERTVRDWVSGRRPVPGWLDVALADYSARPSASAKSGNTGPAP